MKNKCKALVVLVLSIICSTAVLAEIPAGKVYTKAEYDLAYRLLEIMDTKKNFEALKSGMLDMQLKTAPQLVPYKQIFVKFFDKYMEFNLLRKELADIYLDIFTAAEIKELTAFYQTPLGKKLIEKTPELTLRSSQLGQNVIMKHIPELQEELKKAIEADQKKLSPASENPPVSPQDKP